MHWMIRHKERKLVCKELVLRYEHRIHYKLKGNKNGYNILLCPETGKEVWKRSVGRCNNCSRKWCWPKINKWKLNLIQIIQHYIMIFIISHSDLSTLWACAILCTNNLIHFRWEPLSWIVKCNKRYCCEEILQHTISQLISNLTLTASYFAFIRLMVATMIETLCA